MERLWAGASGASGSLWTCLAGLDPTTLGDLLRVATQTGRLFDKAPKAVAGVRAVSFPAELLAEVTRHLEQFAAPGRDGHVFVGPQGGQLRRSNFRDDWVKARKATGVSAELQRALSPGWPLAGLTLSGP
ncbi:hypothetical protein ACIQMV_12880 [Streptomyces sp. NPDC091412]|uniref:hypothetical protein n=1 Tax=Streptomyces sp. NPDC091412 TaxID=3366002 RepID=UPI0037F95C5C